MVRIKAFQGIYSNKGLEVWFDKLLMLNTSSCNTALSFSAQFPYQDFQTMDSTA